MLRKHCFSKGFPLAGTGDIRCLCKISVREAKYAFEVQLGKILLLQRFHVRKQNILGHNASLKQRCQSKVGDQIPLDP